jgi:hypothetical protein
MSVNLKTDSTPVAGRITYAEHLQEELQEFATYDFLLPPKEPLEEVLARLYKTLGVEREVQQHVQEVGFPSLALLVTQANTLSTKVKEANGS